MAHSKAFYQSQFELRQTGKCVRVFFEKTSVDMWLRDGDMKIFMANIALQEIPGYSLAELECSDIAALIHPGMEDGVVDGAMITFANTTLCGGVNRRTQPNNGGDL